MRFKDSVFFALLFGSLVSCSSPSAPEQQLFESLEKMPALSGKAEYLSSPYSASGDRVYLIGNQDGTFPDLGWHVEGEMGGLWRHPIKLMDGFTASISIDNRIACLDKAISFTNYPIGNVIDFGIVSSNLSVKRLHFVPDAEEGMVLLFQFDNLSGEEMNFEFQFNAYVDLMPVWLSEQKGMLDGADQINFDPMTNIFTGKDEKNDWFTVWSSASDILLTPSEVSCEMNTKGNGAAAGFSLPVNLPADSNTIIPVFIAGSDKSEIQALETLAELRLDLMEKWTKKKNRLQSLKELAEIQIPDSELQQAFEWVKYNTDWLVREVPGIGRGFGAGLQDYPWWFGVDTEYTVQGLIATGRKELVYESIELIHSLSEAENGNGKIVHEVSTNGVVFNSGNINETPQFASMIWEVYRWTGDRDFLEKYFPTIEKGLNWLLMENDQDANLLADGYGMMEIHGLESEMIDVASYSQKAFADAAKMAEVLEKTELAKSYQEIAETLAERINTDFWVPEFGSYADFIGTVEDAMQLVDGAIVRADTLNKSWAVEELKATKEKLSRLPKDQKQAFVLYHNWVVNTPMETGIADPEKARIALETGRKYTNPFGVYVTGIDRDEQAESEVGTFEGSKDFSYTGAVMTLATGVQAIGENNYGNPDAALDYLKRMTRSFGFALPGSIYEVSPDYGMFTQAWNMYSFAVPIITQFFGIQPDAGNNVVYFRPQMPSAWEKASISNVIIGDNVISMNYENKDGILIIEVEQSQKRGGLSIEIPKEYEKIKMLGKEVSTDTQDGFRRILMTGAKARIEASKE